MFSCFAPSVVHFFVARSSQDLAVKPLLACFMLKFRSEPLWTDSNYKPTWDPKFEHCSPLSPNHTMFSSPGCVSSKEAAPHGGCIEAKAAKWKDGTCFCVFVVLTFYFCWREWDGQGRWSTPHGWADNEDLCMLAAWWILLQEGAPWF